MTIILKAFFTQSGVPKTGLTPTIWIYDLTDSAVDINDSAMTEVGKGLYSYSFAAFDQHHEYVYRVDGTSTLSGSERYQHGELKYNTQA